MKNVLHDWDDDAAITVLKNCHRAMNDGVKLLAIEVVLPESLESSFGNLLDINMLVMSGGENVPKLNTGAFSRRVVFDLQESFRPWPPSTSSKACVSP